MSCVCGYNSVKPATVRRHQKTCKAHALSLNGNLDEITTLKVTHLEEKVKLLQDQLLERNEQIKEKDGQINELIQLIKKPRVVNNNTTNNNKYVVEQHINVFGKESIKHISHEEIQALLADPANAVPQFIKLKHKKAPGGVNQNLRVPNKKRAIYQVVVPGGEGKEWENKAKGEALEELYDTNSGHLEAEADEETRVGSQFLNHQEKVKASASGEDGGRRYKEQLDKIHCVVAI